MTEAPRLVDLVVEEPGWEAALPGLAGLAETAARAALHGAGVSPEGREIALLACSDERIAGLNAAFRGKEVPTNVLSWPAADLAPDVPGLPPKAPPEGLAMLGDVAIALQTTDAEACAASRPLKDHAIHLILHGALHLLGYDHERDADAELMEGIERRELARLGIPDPYAEGDAGHSRN